MPPRQLTDGEKSILRELDEDARYWDDCECSDCVEFRERQDEIEAEHRRIMNEEFDLARHMQLMEQEFEDRIAPPEPDVVPY